MRYPTSIPSHETLWLGHLRGAVPVGDLAGGLGSSCLCSAQLLGQGNGRQKGLTSPAEDPWGQQGLGQEMGPHLLWTSHLSSLGLSFLT